MDYNVKPIDQWPDALTPARKREKAKFLSDFNRVFKHLERELKHLHAKELTLFIDVLPGDIRIDGKPRAGAKPSHPGVIISFESKHGPLTYWTDRYTEWVANLRALSLGLETLRSIDRYGMNKQGAQYKGLNEASGLSSEQEAATIILGLAGWPTGQGEIKSLLDDPSFHDKAYRAAAGKAHPDRTNGQRAEWDLLQGAQDVLKARKR